jgi:hypothetical protein
MKSRKRNEKMEQQSFDQLLQGAREMKAIRAGEMAPARVTVIPDDFTVMTCVTLWQPWASALFVPRLDGSGLMLKVHETRGWAPSAKQLKPGDRLAISAAKTQRDTESGEYLADWWNERVRLTAYRAAFAAVGWRDWDDLPFGAIIGFGTFVGATQTERLFGKIDQHDRHWGNFGPHRYGWELRDVKRFPAPIPCRGMQTLFPVRIPNAALAAAT